MPATRVSSCNSNSVGPGRVGVSQNMEIFSDRVVEDFSDLPIPRMEQDEISVKCENLFLVAHVQAPGPEGEEP